MSKHVIPAFCSKEFNSLDQVGKQEFLQTLKYWKNHDLTGILIEYLDEVVQQSIVEEDRQSKFSTLFESKYAAAHKKGERNALRKMVKQLKD